MKHEEPQTVNKHSLIFLVGFMGTGKTHWGKTWAEKLQYVFIDLDELIEAEEGTTVQELFEKKGEDYFREKEAATLRRMGQKQHTIISCGGGTPCFFDNMEWMNKNGTTVFLRSGPAFIMQNIKKEAGKRPLVRGMNDEEMLSFIDYKLKQREKFYSQADIILDAEKAGVYTIENIIPMK